MKGASLSLWEFLAPEASRPDAPRTLARFARQGRGSDEALPRFFTSMCRLIDTHRPPSPGGSRLLARGQPPLNLCCIPACRISFLRLNGRLTIPAWGEVEHWSPSRGEGLTEIRDALSASVRMRSVDDWPLAKILDQISGGKPGSVAVFWT